VSIDVNEAADAVQQLLEISHDMRQPVASVFALAAVALAEPGLSVGARQRLEQIVEQATWLSDMIDGFLHDAQREEADDASRMDACETGRVASRPDVVSVLSEVIAAGRLTWPCGLTVASPAVPVRCTLPPALLRRVVSNVLSNAARAAGPSGIVTVQISRHAGLALVTVEDSGPGFGNIPAVTGLGLSAVARNIVRYGGRVECSSGPGGGARVSLWLPG
jgi:signal transduction histidine kinase